jgi:hypothetical protein
MRFCQCMFIAYSDCLHAGLAERQAAAANKTLASNEAIRVATELPRFAGLVHPAMHARTTCTDNCRICTSESSTVIKHLVWVGT